MVFVLLWQNAGPRVSFSNAGVLRTADAVAAIIVLDDSLYVLQRRDNVPGIWYPDHWGCFGGGVNQGEAPLAALRRELREELEWEPRTAAYFTRLDFDLSELGLGRYHRIYYTVPMARADLTKLVVHEGQGFAAFPAAEALATLRIAPYDAFALFLYHARYRIAAQAEQAR